MPAPTGYVLQPDDTLSPGTSLYVGYGVGVVAWAALCLAVLSLWLFNKRGARRVREASVPNAKLHEGPAVIAGVAELAANAEHAVVVEITQRAKQWETKTGYGHKWTEVDRRVRAAPFYIVRANGERVRVQPARDVYLIDAMSRHRALSHDRRVRIVELEGGEQVLATGVLRRDFDPQGVPGGYRDSPVGWILTPPNRGRMVVSTQPVDDRFLRAQRFHRRALVIALLCFAGVQLAMLSYHLRTLAGSTATAEVQDKTHWTTRDHRNRTRHHWQVNSITPWGELHEEEVVKGDYHAVARGNRVAIVHVNQALVQYGDRPGLHFFVGVSILVGLGIGIGLYVAGTRKLRPWYLRKVVDHGSGAISQVTGLDDPMI